MPRVTGVRVTYNSAEQLEPFFEVLTFDKVSLSKPLGNKETITTVYTNFATMQQGSITVLSSGDSISSRSDFKYAKYKVVGNEMVCGWNCVKYRASTKGKLVEIWATDNIGFNGTPAPEYGVINGLVLKVAVNGNVSFNATYVDRLIGTEDLWPKSWGKLVKLRNPIYK